MFDFNMPLQEPEFSLLTCMGLTDVNVNKLVVYATTVLKCSKTIVYTKGWEFGKEQLL